MKKIAVRSFIICNFHQILLVIKSKIFKMGEKCFTDVEIEKCV
jgi:hypothetical protein